MVDKNSIHTILIPDVHGRKFWGDALPFIEQGVPTIFLGDYLDVYSFENIRPITAVEQFERLIELSRTHDNVQLLLGNHDAGYALDTFICDCRTDRRNFNRIRADFRENIDLFKLCKTVEVNGKRFMISHAGIHPAWIETYSKHFDNICKLFHIHHEHLEDLLNDILMTPFKPDFNAKENDNTEYWRTVALSALGACSSERGGCDPAGSLIWSDIHEFQWTGNKRFNLDQVVGHTMQYYSKCPVVLNGITCIDCFDCFYIDFEGDLRRLKDGRLAEELRPDPKL